MCTEVKPFSERNPFIVGAVGLGTLVAVTVGAVQYDKLPFLGGNEHYGAYFVETGGLKSGSPVQVAGHQVGTVTSIDIDGPRVLVGFDVSDDVHVGDRSEARIRTKSLLGSKVLEITPRGGGTLTGTIPLERTTSPYQLPDVLGELSDTVEKLDTATVSDALGTLSTTFADSPPELRLAVEGMGRFSQTLGERDEQLRNLLARASDATGVLSARAEKITGLVSDTNALLAQLQSQSAALDSIAANISDTAQQLKALIADNRNQFRPALDKLNGVLAIVDDRKERVQASIVHLNQYAMSLGESVGSGPFFKAYIANLLPGQFIQPFIDAAFSDLGLDPNVMLPSELSSPQTGQSATPPLPVPFPRTGQGGQPRLTVPDAITGNPGDPRYPYREPDPAPPPGGPPPGPPALPPSEQSSTQPAPAPVYLPAPNEGAAVVVPPPVPSSIAGQEN